MPANILVAGMARSYNFQQRFLCSAARYSIYKLKVLCRRVRSTHHHHWCVERTLHDYCCSKIELELVPLRGCKKCTLPRY